jgi:hypothetical protein
MERRVPFLGITDESMNRTYDQVIFSESEESDAACVQVVIFIG